MKTKLLAAMLALAATAFAQRTLPFTRPLEIGQMISILAPLPNSTARQVVEASANWEQIQKAAKFADAHPGLTGSDLTAALAQAKLKFDPSVIALLLQPRILDAMANNMTWTARLGEAYLNQRDVVIFALNGLHPAPAN